MKKISQYLTILLFCLSLSACHSEKEQTNSRVVTVYPRANTSHLYYNGIIKPLQEDLIISPANGIVNKMKFHYGDFVKKGDVLFTIHSPDMENEFRDCLTNYLRVKQAYLNSKNSMIGTQALYNEKIISQQEYENDKSQYQNNTLSFVAASTKLKQFINYLPSYKEKFVDSDTINLDDAVKILQSNMEDLTITAPSSGIVLFPEQKSSDGNKELQVGLEIKKHDVLLEIGNLSGLSITADVTENDINNVKSGSSVILSLQSDLESELKGVIVSVAKQAKNSDSSSSLSTFPVGIQVPSLSNKTMQKIRVGMNAKLDILVEEPPAIKIPISGVVQKNHRAFVKKIDPNGKAHEVPVLTGATTQQEVTILRGLKKGDKILIDD